MFTSLKDCVKTSLTDCSVDAVAGIYFTVEQAIMNKLEACANELTVDVSLTL